MLQINCSSLNAYTSNTYKFNLIQPLGTCYPQHNCGFPNEEITTNHYTNKEMLSLNNK